MPTRLGEAKEKHLGVRVGDEKEHWAEREKEARAAW